MGFFSWKTQDTDESIPCVYNSTRRPITVHMHDNKGNFWKETQYEGYGIFGGKDYYELLAEMNDLTTREEGITLAYSGKAYLSPNLVESANWKWQDAKPESCPSQGYFYSDFSTDYEDEEDDDSSWLKEDEEDDEFDDPSRDHLNDEEDNFVEEQRNLERENDY